ncbi:Mss4p nuclear export [Basidiobolus ranarum]|uniref:Protein BCP1 n=1 Tax=Basidiobolus ranarum TaxID=34480 RepID=A0ABR2WAW5_9FUNG
MSKRKVSEREPKLKENVMDISGDEDEDMTDVVDVDFDFFDPKEIDFHAIKNLLKQLFGSDHELFNLSELTELIIGQPLIGSTIKVDGEGDPYAFMSVLNMHVHKDKECMKQIKEYLLAKCKKNHAAFDKLNTILKEDSNQHVGLLLTDRLVNMPPQTAPPMYKMLAEEIEWAVEDKEPYEFEYYILLSKTYKEVAPTVDEEEMAIPATHTKKKGKMADTILFYFHPEDELISRHADLVQDFKFTQATSVADSKRAFQDYGIAPSRKFMIIHKSKMPALIKNLEEAMGA